MSRGNHKSGSAVEQFAYTRSITWLLDLTSSTCALRASLKALVDTELVGALLDGEDRRAGGDALRQGGGAGGGHRGVVEIVDVLGLHMPGVLVLIRVVHIVVVLHLLVLVLVHWDLLYCNPSREFLRSWWPCCCC